MIGCKNLCKCVCDLKRKKNVTAKPVVCVCICFDRIYSLALRDRLCDGGMCVVLVNSRASQSVSLLLLLQLSIKKIFFFLCKEVYIYICKYECIINRRETEKLTTHTTRSLKLHKNRNRNKIIN